MTNCPECGNPTQIFFATRNGQICESCKVTCDQVDLPVDEYSLRADEYTTPMAAIYMDVSERSIQIWAKAGDLPATRVKRRVDGNVVKRTIFLRSELDALKERQEAPVHHAAIERENSGLPATIAKNGGDPGALIQALVQMVQHSQETAKPTLLQLTGKVFIGIEELSEVTQLAVSGLKSSIALAEKAGSLRRYKGKQGRAVWRSDDPILNEIIADVQPVDAAAIYGKADFGRSDRAPAPDRNESAGEIENTGGEAGRPDAAQAETGGDGAPASRAAGD